MLGDGLVQIGMSSKHMSDDGPGEVSEGGVQREIHIGEDAVALIVSKDVWDGGVKADRGAGAGIYEGRLNNWKDLGGPDQRIAFFNKEPGRGTWEVFAHWVYGNPKMAPQVSFPEVGGNEETPQQGGFDARELSRSFRPRGRMEKRSSRSESRWTDGRSRHDREQRDSGKYPLSRPLFLLTNGGRPASQKCWSISSSASADRSS